MVLYKFIDSIDNKTFNKLRNSLSDAECRRILKESVIAKNIESETT